VQFRLQLLKNSPRARHVVEEAARMAGWAASARDGAWALPISIIPARSSLGGRCLDRPADRCDQGARFLVRHRCRVAVQPDNIIAQTESSIVYGLGLALMERITIANVPCSSRTSMTIMSRA